MEKWTKRLAGERLAGRWTQRTYRLVRYLGSGAAGTVYIAEELPNGRLLALKMSEAFYFISSEVNVLKKLNQSASAYKGPKFYNVDDGVLSRTKRRVHFYTMEYIEGIPYRSFIEKNGQDWAVVFLLQMLKQLELLHRAGWVFGDLKVDNILIAKGKPAVRWFDVGGFTSFGRSIKEYTEFYDQAYWGTGSRKASVQYDLFACSMIFVEAFYPKRFYKTAGMSGSGRTILRRQIQRMPKLRWFLPIMEGIWQGRYRTAMQMHRAVQNGFAAELQRRKGSVRSPHRIKQKKKHSFIRRLAKTSVILLSIAGAYILYLFYQIP